MRVAAYCAQSFVGATIKASGVREPLMCPPLDSGTVPLRRLERVELLYLDLHGEPGDVRWYGDYNEIALTVEQVESLELQNTIVFAVNCYLADTNSPMLDALLDAGAKYVIGGEGKNWGLAKRPSGAPLLGQWFRRLYQFGVQPLRSLSLAKRCVKLSGVGKSKQQKFVVADTLAFRAYYRRTIERTH